MASVILCFLEKNNKQFFSSMLTNMCLCDCIVLKCKALQRKLFIIQLLPKLRLHSAEVNLKKSAESISRFCIRKSSYTFLFVGVNCSLCYNTFTIIRDFFLSIHFQKKKPKEF